MSIVYQAGWLILPQPGLRASPGSAVHVRLFRDIARIGCHSWLDVEERERVEAKEEVGIAGVQWVRNAVVFLIDRSLPAGLRSTLHAISQLNRGAGAKTRLTFEVVQTCAAPRLRQSLAALGSGYGLNEKPASAKD